MTDETHAKAVALIEQHCHISLKAPDEHMVGMDDATWGFLGQDQTPQVQFYSTSDGRFSVYSELDGRRWFDDGAEALAFLEAELVKLKATYGHVRQQ